MASLRNWNGESTQPIMDVLNKFGLETSSFVLEKFEKTSPDSFIWIFYIDNDRHYLYAEDYLTSLGEAMERIAACETEDYHGRSHYTFLKPLKQYRLSHTFDNSNPNIQKREDNFMEHCYQFDYCYIFLAK